MGLVIGAEEWEALANDLDNVGDVFDLATLFLEICLVLGAISLVIDQWKLKKVFFTSMIVLGLVGFVIGIFAEIQGIQVG
jgi:hypothetical protein